MCRNIYDYKSILIKEFWTADISNNYLHAWCQQAFCCLSLALSSTACLRRLRWSDLVIGQIHVTDLSCISCSFRPMTCLLKRLVICTNISNASCCTRTLKLLSAAQISREFSLNHYWLRISAVKAKTEFTRCVNFLHMNSTLRKAHKNT